MSIMRLYPDGLKLYTKMVLYTYGFAYFRDTTTLKVADVSGTPAAGDLTFDDIRNFGQDGDDLHVWTGTSEYWRCSGGTVYKGEVVDGEASGGAEDECTGVSNVRSLQVYVDNSDVYHIVYASDSDPDDWDVNSHIYHATSDNGISWESVSTVFGAVYCDEQRLTYSTNKDFGAVADDVGFFEIDDTYFLEDVEVGDYTVRMFRIGRRQRFTAAGAFSDYEGWTALGEKEGAQKLYAFTYENEFTVTGEVLTGGTLQLLQVT